MQISKSLISYKTIVNSLSSYNPLYSSKKTNSMTNFNLYKIIQSPMFKQSIFTLHKNFSDKLSKNFTLYELKKIKRFYSSSYGKKIIELQINLILSSIKTSTLNDNITIQKIINNSKNFYKILPIGNIISSIMRNKNTSDTKSLKNTNTIINKKFDSSTNKTPTIEQFNDSFKNLKPLFNTNKNDSKLTHIKNKTFNSETSLKTNSHK